MDDFLYNMLKNKYPIVDLFILLTKVYISILKSKITNFFTMLKGSVHQRGPWGNMIFNFKNGVEWNQFQNANLSWFGLNPPKPLKTFNFNSLFQYCPHVP